MFATMCALRIYLRRGDEHEGKGFWSRVFGRPLGKFFIDEALKAGVTHASLTNGNMGFARGEKFVATNVTEVGVDALPVCIELVAPRPLLEQFVRDHQRRLEKATVMMLEGVHILAHAVQASDAAGAKKVEYIRVGQQGASASPHASTPAAAEGANVVAPEEDS